MTPGSTPEWVRSVGTGRAHRTEFENANAQRPDRRERRARRPADAVRSFAHAWDDLRSDMTESIKGLGEASRRRSPTPSKPRPTTNSRRRWTVRPTVASCARTAHGRWCRDEARGLRRAGGPAATRSRALRCRSPPAAMPRTRTIDTTAGLRTLDSRARSLEAIDAPRRPHVPSPSTSRRPRCALPGHVVLLVSYAAALADAQDAPVTALQRAQPAQDAAPDVQTRASTLPHVRGRRRSRRRPPLRDPR